MRLDRCTCRHCRRGALRIRLRGSRRRVPARHTFHLCLSSKRHWQGTLVQAFFKLFLNAKKRQPRRTSVVNDAGHGITPSRNPRVETLVSRTISYAKLVEMLDGQSMTLTLQREDGRSLLKSTLFKDDIDSLTQLWVATHP